MKTTNYAGIDYSGGASNCDTNGIRYGVISQHSVMPEALDDIYTQGRDIAFEESQKCAIDEARQAWEATHGADSEEEFDEDRVAEEFADNYQSDGGLSDYLYERDGYKLTGCLSSDMFVLKSRFFTFAQFCSPCVPGAGNLDSPFEPAKDQQSTEEITIMATAEGFPRVYCLGHDWFENGKAPYPVFSVESGEMVLPVE